MEWYIGLISALVFFYILRKNVKKKQPSSENKSKLPINYDLVAKKEKVINNKLTIEKEKNQKKNLSSNLPSIRKVEKEKFEKIVFNLADNIAVLIEGGMSIEQINKECMPDLEDEVKEIIIKMALNKSKAIKNCGIIYQLDSHRYKEVGKYENGRIYGYTKSGYRSFIEVGKYENGRIYGYTKSGYRSFIEVGKYENGRIYGYTKSGYRSFIEVGKYENERIFRLESNHHYKEVGKYSNDGGGPPSGSLLLLF
jgi:hypothetical protein